MDTFNELVTTRYGIMLINKNDFFIGRSLKIYGEISEEENQVYREICQEGDTVVEAGANIGAHTLPLSTFIGANGTLFCYEPQRIVFQTLNANLALNSITNTTTFQAGLGDKNDFMVVPPINYTSQGNFGGVSIKQNGTGEYVNIFTIDTHLQLSSLKLLKIDVEGMEVEVIKGARNTILEHQPIIYCENDRKERSEELIRLLWSFGYELYWHAPHLYNKNNFNNYAQDIFGSTISINMLCLPKGSSFKPSSLLKLEKIERP